MGDVSSNWAGVGVSAAQSFIDYKQKSVQAELEKALIKENNKATYSAMLSSFRSLEEEQDQTDENFVANDIDSQIMEAKNKGAILAESGASGTGGSAVDMQLDDVEVAGNLNHSRLTLNRQREMNQIRSKGKEAVNVANARFNRMPPQTPKIDLLGMGVNGFRNAVAFNSFSKSLDSVSGTSVVPLDTTQLIDSVPTNQLELTT